MLDELEFPEKLGCVNTGEFFGNENERVFSTSILRHAVFKNGKNYSSSPKILKNDLLSGQMRDYFAKEITRYPTAMIIPMGVEVEAALRSLVLPNPVLWGFPHPSGSTGHRVKFFRENYQAMRGILSQWQLNTPGGKTMAEGTHLIGNVLVESGRVVIADPAHIEDLSKCESLDPSPAQAMSLNLPNGVEFACVSNTRVGDGLYPVYLETRDSFPLRLVIDFETEAGTPADWFKGRED